jgi:hypothetical protein
MTDRQRASATQAVAPAGLSCRQCRHFIDEPSAVEAALPSVTILGSAYSSVRGRAGVCQCSGRFHDPMDARACPDFTARSG